MTLNKSRPATRNVAVDNCYISNMFLLLRYAQPFAIFNRRNCVRIVNCRINKWDGNFIKKQEKEEGVSSLTFKLWNISVIHMTDISEKISIV